MILSIDETKRVFKNKNNYFDDLRHPLLFIINFNADILSGISDGFIAVFVFDLNSLLILLSAFLSDVIISKLSLLLGISYIIFGFLEFS